MLQSCTELNTEMEICFAYIFYARLWQLLQTDGTNPLYERWPNRPHLPIQQQARHTKKISYLPSVDISVYKAGIKGFIYWINIESKARRRDLAWMWSLIQINRYLNIDIRKQDRLLFCLTSHTAGGWQHWVLCLAALPERLPSLEESRAEQCSLWVGLLA